MEGSNSLLKNPVSAATLNKAGISFLTPTDGCIVPPISVGVNVKHFSPGSPPSVRNPEPAQPKLRHLRPTLATPPPYSNAVNRFPCETNHHLSFYPVGTGSSEIRSSVAPNRRRVRCPSASSSQ